LFRISSFLTFSRSSSQLFNCCSWADIALAGAAAAVEDVAAPALIPRSTTMVAMTPMTNLARHLLTGVTV